jgi:hypothetical protein
LIRARRAIQDLDGLLWNNLGEWLLAIAFSISIV